MKISKESSGINLVDSENSIYYLNFQGCFTVQLSRFFAVTFASAINIISNLFDVVNTFLNFLFCFFIASTDTILSNPFDFVNTFFHFLQKSFSGFCYHAKNQLSCVSSAN